MFLSHLRLYEFDNFCFNDFTNHKYFKIYINKMEIYIENIIYSKIRKYMIEQIFII